MKALIESELRRMGQQYATLNLIGKDGKEISGELTEGNDGFKIAGTVFTWEDIKDIDPSTNIITLKPTEEPSGEETG